LTEDGEHSFKRRDFPMPIRILIADDVAPIRVMEKKILREVPDVEVVGEAADPKQAIELSKALKPDLIIMDLKMPGDGPTTTKDIRKVHPEAKILAVTTLTDERVAVVLKEKYEVDALLPKDKMVYDLIPTIHRLTQSQAQA
jgi:DNA-binding NarL/FixJ family response regulator